MAAKRADSDETPRIGDAAQRSSTDEVAELGYEEARDELIVVVRTLEQGGLDLDASLQMWERGEALSRRCEEHLEGARKRIETVLGAESSDADDIDAGDDFDDEA